MSGRSTGVLARLGAAFVAPAPEAVQGPPAAAAAPAPSVALLCPPSQAASAGALLALALTRHERCGHALLCLWGVAAARGLRVPAVPGARKLAASLAGRGHAARAAGRLAVVALAADAPDAAAEAGRAGAAAGRAPTVIALAGPRDERIDALLHAQDLVLVASRAGAAEAPMTALAVDGLVAAGVRAESWPCAISPVAAALARSGVLAPGRVDVGAPLEALA